VVSAGKDSGVTPPEASFEEHKESHTTTVETMVETMVGSGLSSKTRQKNSRRDMKQCLDWMRSTFAGTLD